MTNYFSHFKKRFQITFKTILWLVVAGLFTNQDFAQSADELAGQVIIRRTAHGIPHIQADNFKAAGFALGYVQTEDYGSKIPGGMIRARGEWAKYHELKGDRLQAAIDRDAASARNHRRAVENWQTIDQDTRDMMEGFALGVNRYVQKYPQRFERWVKPDFSGYDVLAMEVHGPDISTINKFLRTEEVRQKNSATAAYREAETGKQEFVFMEKNASVWTRIASNYVAPNPDEGSNAWALAPSRTASGKAILLRNPHLNWDAGYYEAQLEVKGYFNWYGDFRIGAPLDVIGGFNDHLGWATTNNAPILSETYAFKTDPANADHYLLDGASIPIQRETVSVYFKNGEGLGIEKRELLSTPYGPVIFRGNGLIYVIHSAEDGICHSSEQYLKMMKTKNLDEWKQVMRMQAIPSSNYTYADGDGNIFYVWNAAIPDLPLPWSGDTTAVLVSRSSQIWSKPVAWDRLPQLLNPKGGYIHNENSSFHFTNLNQPFDPADFPSYFQKRDFSLRSQKSYEILHANENKKLSLEDVVKLKYNEGMLLADRVKDDLISAVKKSNPKGDVAKALKTIEKWNNTVEKDSRGSTLFRIWWDRYVYTADQLTVRPTPESAAFAATPEKLFKAPWTPDKPATTPFGLSDFKRADDAFKWAVEETKKRYGSYDVSWGEVHRAVAENIDIAIGGCSGAYGCFRVLWYNDTVVGGKNIRKVYGGDGWVIAIEFDKTPKAYSVLAYGESNNPESPYYYDQVQMFSDKKMKPVFYTADQVQKEIIREYRPGRE